ncbi:MAG: N-formylglutamate amidohydrolase [Chloroflexi bacterium]|nr:N-formylglutamate amidohydrolase [Chloroflexota bacterium]
MEKLPVLLSIPHGSNHIPPVVENRVILSAEDIHDDIDPYTREIYDLSEHVEAVVVAHAARTIVDVNRSPDDRPPQNPDGVIKSMTCLGRPIYHGGWWPDEPVTDHLLHHYYLPFHQAIQAALDNPRIKLALDCHSMHPVGPAIGPDTGQTRPLICLGNLHNQSCEESTLRHLAQCLQMAFGLEEQQIALNTPFAGGYITRTYGQHSAPWIQLELNRILYLDPAWFDATTLSVAPERLAALRRQFMAALETFFA